MNNLSFKAMPKSTHLDALNVRRQARRDTTIGLSLHAKLHTHLSVYKGFPCSAYLVGDFMLISRSIDIATREYLDAVPVRAPPRQAQPYAYWHWSMLVPLTYRAPAGRSMTSLEGSSVSNVFCWLLSSISSINSMDLPKTTP